MNIEEIMKPYFDKKEEISKRPDEFKNDQNEIISKYEDENKKHKDELELYESEISALRVRLENLRNNKDREIEEYVQNAVSDRPDFYAGYGALIRKDLEQKYLKREKELEEELEAKTQQLREKINNKYLEIEVNNKLIHETQQLKKYRFHNVDIRELVDVKHELRKTLITTKKELETKFEEVSLHFDTVMNKLSTFKYEYDETHNVLNGNEYKTLFEQSNSLIEKKYNLQRDLKQVDEYLKLTELTEEEVKTIMKSMSDLEKEEYDRRKSVDSSLQNILNSFKQNKVVTSSDLMNEDRVIETAKKAITEQKELEENYSEFIKEISSDVLGCVKSLRSLEVKDGKLTEITPGKENKEYEILSDSSESIELVNGLYLNRRDVEKAVKNYKKQNKGRTFAVKGIDVTLNVTRKSVNRVKDMLRKFSLRDLLKEKKISDFDVKRVYGKDEAEEYIYSTPYEESLTDNYVRLKDVYEAFKELFVEKVPTWKERFVSKFKRPELEDLDQVPYANDEETEDTMTWDAKEPEYEIVKAKIK